MLLNNSNFPTHSDQLFHTVKSIWYIFKLSEYPNIMPGHDHSIAKLMAPGDLTSTEALWLWNCPIIDEGLDIWHYINE